MSDTRKNLTPEERLRCAYAHYVLGIEQQHIAMLMAVNSGRVNEACKGIQQAMLDPKGVRVPAEAESPPAASPEASWPVPEQLDILSTLVQ